MLLPITLPKTISPLFDMRDLIDTANSGALVPNAIIVIPITSFDILKFCCMCLEFNIYIKLPGRETCRGGI